MDREGKQESPSLANNNSNNNNNNIIDESSPRKSVGGGGGMCNNGDRLKRDEWSEGAVSSLLEAYETKWILRNRAKLKGHDWEDVAKHVTSRANFSKSPKTQTQCKNKIESMKKRYRSESATATAEGSSWPLFPRLDLLLRGPPPPNPPLLLLEPSPPQPPPVPHPLQHNSHASNAPDRLPNPKEDVMGTKFSDHVSEKIAIETDSSTPALYSNKADKLKSKSIKTRAEKRKRQRREDWEMSESIRLLAEMVVRSEQARVEAIRELERMRVEAEAKRSEMDLRRTEIIANTQLEIARLFAGVAKGVDSSLRIGRS